MGQMINRKSEAILTLITAILALITIMAIYSIYIPETRASNLTNTEGSSVIKGDSSQQKVKTNFGLTESLLLDKSTSIKRVISKDDDTVEFYGMTFKHKITS